MSGTDPQTKDENPVRSIVRLQKTILFDQAVAMHFDETLINPRFYNGFNYSLLSGNRQNGHMTLGITSPNAGDGKTIVAANLAVSLAHTTENEVVLVDMNVQHPKIHRLFSVSRKPGLMESLNGSTIRVCPTKIRNLAILPLGDVAANPLQGIVLVSGEAQRGGSTAAPTLRLEDLSEFRNVLYSLEERFDLIIVDLPPMREPSIPALFVRQLNGVIVVISPGKTKRGEVDELFSQLDPNQIFGFVFNRSESDRNL